MATPIRMLVMTILVGSVATVILTTARAARQDPRWYWVAALGAWVFSFLCSFSIGLYTLAGAFALAALAAGHSLGLIRRSWHGPWQQPQALPCGPWR